MDWENNQEEGKNTLASNNTTTINNNITNTNNNGGGGMFVKVMTDEQMEVLRKQIAVYATICQQLVDLHKSLTNQHDLAGVRMGNPYCDPSMGHKITGRQRWTPTPVQLQILERMFEQDVLDLKESNRFLHQTMLNLKWRQRSEELCFQNPEISSGMHSLDPGSQKVEPVYPSGSSSKPAASMGQMSFYGSMLSNPRMDHLIGKMENPGNYNAYMHPDDYNMSG
ncbi:hypothetical protein POM88_046061 [Heracleum sosnowskyi]|uniref:Uncharacterized protein n=1 Tax=Heracleum sosnowskyi TaxID=360622 RepID=A0AAD8H8L7_9APIA|nr:hypothetical protein POM88_046061 [Heracleum sosnowskyi]